MWMTWPVVPLRICPALGVVDGVPDLDVVVVVEPVGPAGDGQAVVAELVVLVADGLGAGV